LLMRSHKSLVCLLLTLLVLSLSACNAELYSNLTEKEANEMLAVLLERGISIDKIPEKEMKYTLLVSKGDMARALQILQDAGYPRDRFESIGQIFTKKGLVSSPLEERVRFIYALSQEISETISKIDGVLAARVHVVIPENNPLSDTIMPSSAAVFVKYRQDSNVEFNIPSIKKLVVNSIEGLAYDKVTVVLFESEVRDGSVQKPPFQRVLSVKVAPDSVTRFWLLTGGLIFLLLLSLGAMGYMLLLNTGRKKRVPPGVENG
jgi:type III secretion protein J